MNALAPAVWTATCLASALCLHASTHAAFTPAVGISRAASVLPDEASGPSEAGHPVFRLGNAARPFGWSTVIADFNADGRPDVAVADRVARRANDNGYRIELWISGREPALVTFDSTHDAVTLSAFDLDRDADLDLVVRAFSGETVAVWLNDGHGYYTSAAVPIPAAIGARHALTTDDQQVDPASLEPSSRGAASGVPVFVRADRDVSARRLAGSANDRLPFRRHSSSAGPRAPPRAADGLTSAPASDASRA